MTPTPEDLARDAEVDLELEGMLGEPTFPMAANLSRLMGVPQSARDAAYIHYARPALRAWIRRATAAEARAEVAETLLADHAAENKTLHAIVNATPLYRLQCNDCGYTSPGEVPLAELEQLRKEHLETCPDKGGWREVARLRAELARLKQWTYCAYCGFEVSMDADGSLVAEHIRTCEKHPMREVEAEVSRLKAGKFTEEEFQNLCHNFSEDHICRFFQGCAEYQKQLFGRCHVEELQREIAKLREINAGFADRIAAQSDQLSQNAERSNALVLAEREACANIVCDFVKGTKDAFLGEIIAAVIGARESAESPHEDRYEPCGECGVECVLSEGYCKGCEKEQRV